jgi:hypothetical protein
MTLGLALILIFILYLIDKHSRWREAAKIIAGLISLSILGIGGFYGLTKYGEYRTAKQEAAQQAAIHKSIQDCITRNSHAAGPRDIFDDVSAQVACEKDPSTLPPCWSKPTVGNFQVDQNNEQDLNGKRIPPDPKLTCFPIPPACKNGLVVGCVDGSAQPWKKYGLQPAQTKVYEIERKRYEVPKDTTLDELDAVIKEVSKDADNAKASPEDQKGYLAYLIETNRKQQGK